MIDRPRFLRLTGALCVTLMAGSASGAGEKKPPANQQMLIASGLCAQMRQLVNTMVTFTTTECSPSQEATGIEFLFTADKPVFAVEGAKKAWLMMITGAAGKVLGDNPTVPADQIMIADSSMAKSQHYVYLASDAAKSLQKDVSTHKIPLDAMWQKLEPALKSTPPVKK